MSVKKFVWIDAVRIFAVIAVMIDHYLKTFYGHCDFDVVMLTLMQFGNLGVILFFAISGYLVPSSLERSSSIWEFYRKKLVRIIIPFTVSYILLGALLLFLGILNPEFAGRFTGLFFNALYNGTGIEKILLGMLPLELNLVMYFGIPYSLFVGEWFMGAIVILFLLAPLLYKCMRRAPIISLIFSLTISVGIFYAVQDLAAEGRILNGFWVSVVRIPEFLFGMILFTYKDFFQKHKAKLLILSEIVIAVLGTYALIKYGTGGTEFISSPLERLYPLHPRSFIISFPTIYLFFNAFEYITANLPKIFESFLNKFRDISYMVMLIQHVIIYEFADYFHVENFSGFGMIILFLIILMTVIVLSHELKKFSDPVEKFFMK